MISMATTEVQAANGDVTIRAGRLTDCEKFWRSLQPWLLTSGYQLRERFAPDWTLSSEKPALLSPDGLPLLVSP